MLTTACSTTACSTTATTTLPRVSTHLSFALNSLQQRMHGMGALHGQRPVRVPLQWSPVKRAQLIGAQVCREKRQSEFHSRSGVLVTQITAQYASITTQCHNIGEIPAKNWQKNRPINRSKPVWSGRTSQRGKFSQNREDMCVCLE